MSSLSAILEPVVKLTGLGEDAAERIARVVVAVLCEQLAPVERARVVPALPARLAPAVSTDTPAPTAQPEPPLDSLDGFYQRIGRRLGVEVGAALELAQLVLSRLGATLDPDTRTLLELRLPEGFATLLEPRSVHALPAHPAESTRRYATLAEGRPGASHPLSQVRPEDSQHDSVARADNPHADDKLSSSHAPAHEDVTLAGGKPGSRRPLSSGNE